MYIVNFYIFCKTFCKEIRWLIDQKMARQFQVYLQPTGCLVTYSCIHCRAHLADHSALISKSFQGSQGRAYLFDKVIDFRCRI